MTAESNFNIELTGLLVYHKRSPQMKWYLTGVINFEGKYECQLEANSLFKAFFYSTELIEYTRTQEEQNEYLYSLGIRS
jgi:hypothetical protein